MVDQLKTFADERLIHGCIYCGGSDNTRDHVPSRVFLDTPLPENLPVVGACLPCNNGFSKDEEYLACLVESTIAGTTDPALMRRPKVAEILRRAPPLRARLEAAKTIVDGRPAFAIESDRVRNVLVKLARGHVVFELSQPCRQEPRSVWWASLVSLTKEELDDFDACHVVEMFGEVGSRSLQRAMVIQAALRIPNGVATALNMLINDWVDVQEGRYRYLATDEADVRVKIVIGEYLACQVVWDK
jgi:hypothetical protein